MHWKIKTAVSMVGKQIWPSLGCFMSEFTSLRRTHTVHNPLVRLSVMVARNHAFTRRRVLNERSTVQVVEARRQS